VPFILVSQVFLRWQGALLPWPRPGLLFGRLGAHKVLAERFGEGRRLGAALTGPAISLLTGPSARSFHIHSERVLGTEWPKALFGANGVGHELAVDRSARSWLIVLANHSGPWPARIFWTWPARLGARSLQLLFDGESLIIAVICVSVNLFKTILHLETIIFLNYIIINLNPI
jgi:hypothetical protein